MTTPRTWRHLRPAGLSLALVLCSTFSARTPLAAAQKQLKPNQPYALIFGTVWGPDDRPVFGVPVKIRRVQDKRARWELYSDHRGEFAQRISAGKAAEQAGISKPDFLLRAGELGVPVVDIDPDQIDAELSTA